MRTKRPVIASVQQKKTKLVGFIYFLLSCQYDDSDTDTYHTDVIVILKIVSKWPSLCLSSRDCEK